MRALGLLIATVGGVGYAPIAPGTAGSLVGLVVLFGVRLVGDPVFELSTLLAVVLVGTWAAGVGERVAGREDPGLVVVDEVAGMLLTMLWIPLTWMTGIIGFLAFRVFDIIKPFPAGQAERLPGGVGIMADDLVAGVYAWLVVRLLFWVSASVLAS